MSTTQRSNSTVSKLALALSKDDDGKELICRAENPRFPGGVLEEVKTLRISCEFSFLFSWVLVWMSQIWCERIQEQQGIIFSL